MYRLPTVCSLLLAISFLSLTQASAAVSSARPPLIPQPREFTARDAVSLTAEVRISALVHNEQYRFAADDLAEGLKLRGVRVRDTAAAAHIYLLSDGSLRARTLLSHAGMTFDPVMRPEGYVLLTRRHGAFVIAHTGTGVYYGVQTLKQLVATAGVDLN